MNPYKERYLDLKIFLLLVVLVLISISIYYKNPTTFSDKTIVKIKGNLGLSLPNEFLFSKKSLLPHKNKIKAETNSIIPLQKNLVQTEESTFDNYNPSLSGYIHFSGNQITSYNSNSEIKWTFQLPKDELIDQPSSRQSQNWLSFYSTNYYYIINLQNGAPQFSKAINPTEIKIPTEVHDDIEIRYEKNEVHVFSDNTLTKPYIYTHSFNEITGSKRLYASKSLLLTHDQGYVILSLSDASVKHDSSEILHIRLIKELENEILFTNIKNQLLSLDSRNFKENWRISLQSKPITPLYKVPNTHLIAMILESNYLRTISHKDGKRVWRLKLYNENSKVGKLFSLPISKSFMNKLDPNNAAAELIAAPCGLSKICLIHPTTGRALSRLRFKEHSFTGEFELSKDALTLITKKDKLYYKLKFQ
ncbi:MAG: hypothetical protein HOO06_10015 [Bdellovibrionaceae bacterium]|jgi:hypothetical protein|nr:hypothetical protein [Pseudobdellovibrionaceae bacterium]